MMMTVDGWVRGVRCMSVRPCLVLSSLHCTHFSSPFHLTKILAEGGHACHLRCTIRLRLRDQ